MDWRPLHHSMRSGVTSPTSNRPPDGYPLHHLTNPMEILRHSPARSPSRVTERMANFLRGVLLCKRARGEGGKFDELWARIDLSIRSAKASRRIRVISFIGKSSSPESFCVLDTRTSLSLIITPRMLNIRTKIGRCFLLYLESPSAQNL